MELEGNGQLGPLFGRGSLAYSDTELARPPGGGRLRARQLTPGDALRDYVDTGGLKGITGRLVGAGMVDVVTTAAPGIRDLLVLGKIRQLEQRGEADLIVVDAPASGQALAFLLAPAGLARVAASGPVRHQADLALEMLADERRCQVLLVTLPEEGPVNEVVETAYNLEDRVGVQLGPVVVNGCWPDVDGLERALAARLAAGSGAGAISGEQAARFRLERLASQAEQIGRLGAELPLPRIRLPYRFTPALAPADLEALADALLEELTRLPTAGRAP